MDSGSIIDAIVDVIGQNGGPMWSVGITSDPEACKKRHNAVEWHQWEADSLDVASSVETHFGSMFLTGFGSGCSMNGRRIFVYLFW